MATSGSFITGESMGRSLKFSWERTSYSIADNTSTISWSVKGSGSYSGWVSVQNVSVTINGTKVYENTSSSWQAYPDTVIASGTATIAHNSDGTKTFSASLAAGVYSYQQNVNGSGSWTLDSIPRYATVNQSLVSKGETTVTIKWSSDSTIDYLWYSTNNGSSWTGLDVADGKSGSYTISNLSSNTAYNIKTRVRRKDSQLTTDSSALAVTTYSYPYATTMPNFIIGNKLTISLYNPLGRKVTVVVLGADNSQIASDETTGTSISGYAGDTIVNRLYASIPNSKSGTYKVRVTYYSHVSTKTGGTYTVNESACLPSIGSVAYQDVNNTVVAITEDDQQIVRNQSTVRYTATGLSAQKSASVASCKVVVNSNTYNLTISGTSATGGNASINSGSNVSAVFTVTDSRGLTASKTISVKMLDWQLPSAIITLERKDNYYSTSYITVDADYSYVNGKNTIDISARYRQSGELDWVELPNVEDNVTAEFEADNSYSWDIVVTLEDRFGGITTYNKRLSRGMPIIFFDKEKSSVGINCFPKHEQSLEIYGWDLFFQKGDTFVTPNSGKTAIVTGGVLTNSGTRIYFSLTVPKIILGVTVHLEAMKLNIWHSDGGYCLSNAYVNNGYDVKNDSNISISVSISSQNVITFILDKKSGTFNGTNNTPVAVQMHNITLSIS